MRIGLVVVLVSVGLGCVYAQDPAPHGAVRKAYPLLQEEPFGKGIFAHIENATGKERYPQEQVEVWAKNPHVAGTQLAYCWVRLEPEEGHYRWDIIEQDMDLWARHGKKCWIDMATAGRWWKGTDCDPATPEWVFQKGVPRIGAKGTATYPLFWDPKYVEWWGNFIRAFAKKFDGDPRIEFVATGGYSNGHEPRLAAKENDALMDQWKKAGFDGFTASGVYFNKAIKPILQVFRDAFRKTPIAQTINEETDLNRAMNQFAAEQKFILTSNGLAFHHANAASRKKWRERREELGVKVGYAEWGPWGRKTESKNQKSPSEMVKLLDAYRAAIGDDEDAKLKPKSRISYLPFSPRIPEVETEEEWNAALKWAWERLEK